MRSGRNPRTRVHDPGRVIDAPTWTFDYGFHPKMGEAIGAVTERSGGILLGRTTDATWRNSEIVGPYDADRIRRLKDEVDGDIYVSGSAQLVRGMPDDGLIDELHLFVYPLTLGGGPRLFPDNAAPSKLELARSDAYDNGVVYQAYRPQA